MTKCMLCGSPMRLRFKAQHSILWCDDCAFGRIDADLTPEKVATFYGPDYYTHGANGVQFPLSFVDRVLMHIAWRVDHGNDHKPPASNGRPASMCDIGCGGGENLKAYADADYDVIGVDPDKNAAAFKSWPTLLGSAENLPHELRGRRFDVVLMSHSLEHCIDPVKAVRNAASLLNQNGRLIVEVPNNACYAFEKYGAKWPCSDLPRHLSFFTRRSLAKILSGAGLEPSFEYVGFCRQFHPARKRGQKSTHTHSAIQLARTAFSTADLKYDSIRAVGSRL